MFSHSKHIFIVQNRFAMTYYNNEVLIYIDPLNNEEVNNAIAENYYFIVNKFNQFNIPFVYLPKLLADDHFNEVLKYNHPYLKDFNPHYSNKLYHLISNDLNLTLNGPTLIYLSNEGEVTHQFDINSTDLLTSRERLSSFAADIKNKITSFQNFEEDIRFRKTPNKKSLSINLSIERDYDEILKKETVDNLFGQKSFVFFEEEDFEIPRSLQDQIEELREAGYLSHLIKYLEILQQTTQKLSKLKITEDYDIYLMDYEMKEVKMHPLSKALFILFLNHPKGIPFKELCDYRTELMDIYKNISQRENPRKAIKSIEKLTDPFDNSIHEKCSRIRAAFLSIVADEIAQNYYITGRKGEVKRILLNRELVIYDL